MGAQAKEVHCVAGGFFADVGALGGGETRDGVGGVDVADIGWGALWSD
jgi:hypothetical protein